MASKLTSADIGEVTRQSDVISKNLRDNFTNLKNKTNEVIDDLAAVAIGTTNAETTAARPYHTDLSGRLNSIWKGRYNYLKSGGVVTAQGTPNMTVAVSAGEAKIDGIDVKWAAQNSGTVTAPGSNTRLDLVVANSDSTLSIVTGAAAASPVFPSVATTQLVLAALVVKNTTTSLNVGTEIVYVKNFSNPYFPNLYINSNYTATNKKHNNVIVDLSSATITGTLECQGNCWIIDYSNPAANGTGEGTFAEFGRSNSTTDWILGSATTRELQSSAYTPPLGGTGNYNPYVGGAGAATGNLVIDALNVYIYDIDLSGGDGASATTEVDPDATANFNGISPGDLIVAASGGSGSNSGDVTLRAVNEIEVLTGGTVSLVGGDGANGNNTSTGTIGNLGGNGGNSGDGGTFTYSTKTYTNNGTVTIAAGTAGTAGTGSGGSDANGNGAGGTSGSAGSTAATLYDFTDGLPSTYADWIHPLYLELTF
jgi:hypothetical protein